ncbi:hypothetical protein HYZ97_00800 [Candidatus Pacearchaeota archaeon]|nr:hypothetical protein [Candidatus Pacearchaeota archaeon]
MGVIHKTLLQLLGNGQVIGRYFHNTTYDPENPMYQVTEIRQFEGRGEPSSGILTLRVVFIPDNYSDLLVVGKHLDDREANDHEVHKLLNSFLERQLAHKTEKAPSELIREEDYPLL